MDAKQGTLFKKYGFKGTTGQLCSWFCGDIDYSKDLKLVTTW
jgi:hypothetical protein